jgi:uncharacterized ParB-like nuclease family protein
MPRVEHQLREYFEAGVDRLTVDDVIAQAAVRNGDAEPIQERASLRPVWAAAAGFALTLAAFGGVFVVIGLLRFVAGNEAAGGFGQVAAPAGGIAVWSIAAVGAAVVAALAGRLARRPERSAEVEDNGKVNVMETMEKPTVEKTTNEQLRKRNRWLIVAVAVLLVAVLGLGAWMAFGTRPLSPNAAPAEVQQLMENYTAAWNAADADALEALVTPTFRMHGPGIDRDLAAIQSFLVPWIGDQTEWELTTDGPYYAVDGTWFVSSEGSTIASSAYTDGDGVENAVWRVVERDGKLLIQEHYAYSSSLSGNP